MRGWGVGASGSLWPIGAGYPSTPGTRDKKPETRNPRPETPHRKLNQLVALIKQISRPMQTNRGRKNQLRSAISDDLG